MDKEGEVDTGIGEGYDTESERAGTDSFRVFINITKKHSSIIIIPLVLR